MFIVLNQMKFPEYSRLLYHNHTVYLKINEITFGLLIFFLVLERHYRNGKHYFNIYMKFYLIYASNKGWILLPHRFSMLTRVNAGRIWTWRLFLKVRNRTTWLTKGTSLSLHSTTFPQTVRPVPNHCGMSSNHRLHSNADDATSNATKTT